MAVVRRSPLAPPPARGAPVKRVLPREERVKIPELPTVPSKIRRSFAAYSWLIHGRAKIGKTSLFSHEEGALFLECDPHQNALSLLQLHMPNWATFTGVVEKLEASAEAEEFAYRTGIIDRIDLLYKHCYEWCRINKFDGVDPGDMPRQDSGQAWALLKDTFYRWIVRFMALPWSTRFLCHSKTKEVELLDGSTEEKLAPDLPGQADSVITGAVDVLACYTYIGRRRVIIIEGSDMVHAGSRLEKNFRTPDGERVCEIPAGKSSAEAYANVLRAFKNEQTFAYLSEKKKEGGVARRLK